jgi:hypothetical protein
VETFLGREKGIPSYNIIEAEKDGLVKKEFQDGKFSEQGFLFYWNRPYTSSSQLIIGGHQVMGIISLGKH